MKKYFYNLKDVLILASRFMASFINIMKYLIIVFLFLGSPLHASFIEQTIGTAVVKDATAVYFNPAALTISPHQQLILLGTLARAQFEFSGSAQKIPFGGTESGSTTSKSNFFLPSMYLGIPINERFVAGFAVVANDFNRELDNQPILRYILARNQTHNIDFIPALGIKINQYLSIGGNINFTYAHLIQEPIAAGISRLNIPESRSLNDSQANSLGGDFGVLIKPGKKTALGFNYRSSVTYNLQGSSTITGSQYISSDDYHFKYWTPARGVVTLSHFINEKLGFIGTVQYLQWNIFKEVSVYNFATQVASQVFIVPRARINYHFHNSWLLTLGTIYQVSPKWVVRVAGTYNQSPSNGRFQIGPGDSLVTGFSMGYRLMNHLTVDFGYGHGFFKKEQIDIQTSQNVITGINEGAHDAVSLKFTLTA
ncbi:long-chain fatty acid transporter [Fluoribacter gormanii]|uniref:47 kDa outer membrane protein n=2 Tax=Fluoribacter gormanii TaxID=464 RepID=A0A377GIR2_9GAMM|nr:long-chain fatty acid transporter [Fluoribacter gormanii]SIQ92182.1 Long-chain fatty acid transport protein [Fluoribacter gormanii]STO24729.1 47 kDa outer membrane protein precursor [Fluoribacter gormanii]